VPRSGYADNLIKWRFRNWPAEAFIRTGYWSPLPGDIFKVSKKLTEPYHNRLFFAGDHTQMDFFGYMEGALRSGERAAETLMLQACGLREETAPKPESFVRVAHTTPTRESAAFEREVAIPFKKHASADAGEAVSPFLGQDLFAAGVQEAWEPRVAALVAESPFVGAFEERRSGLDRDHWGDEKAFEELDGKEGLEASEAWENLEVDQLTPQADQAEDESLVNEGALLHEENNEPNAEGFDATLEWEEPGCLGEEASLDTEAEWFDSEIWTGSAEQIAFRDRVLAAHLSLSKKARGAPQPDLPDDALECVPRTKIKTLPSTAVAAGRLLAAANLDLAKAQQAEDADALRTIQLTVISGYRGSAHQRNLWIGYFSAKHGYYESTQAAREKLPDGPHSDQAVAYMLRPKRYGGFGLAGKIAAPGYSNHQGGIAIDFWQERRKGHAIENKSDEASRARWRSTWFHVWLKKKCNAATYSFKPIATEEWHWEYRPEVTAAAPSRSAIRPASVGVPASGASASEYLGGKLWTFTAKTMATRMAVFCPKAALAHSEVEVLVFAHGLLSGCPRPKRIPDGFVTDAPFNLGQIVDASGRPMVLVVPFLDWAKPGGEYAFGKGREHWHALAKPGSLNAAIAEVLAELGRVRSRPTPSLGALIIAGHSRAYDFLEPLAYSRADPRMQQGALAKLSQVWAFDTTYGGQVEQWIDWLNRDARLRVAICYRPGSKTAAIGDRFYARRGARLAVVQASEGHCEVPATRLPALLKLPAPDQNLFAAGPEEEWEPRPAALAAESPFQSAFEERQSRFDEDQGEREETPSEFEDEGELTPQTDQEEDESLDDENASPATGFAAPDEFEEEAGDDNVGELEDEWIGAADEEVAPWAAGIDPFPAALTIAFNTNDIRMMKAFTSVTVSTPMPVCTALVDLTGNPVMPPYAGVHDEEMVFAGSLPKICAMYAAFALRSRVQAFVDAAAANGAPVVPPGIIAEIKKAWKPKLQALFPSRPATSFGNKQDVTFPKLDQILTFSPDGKVEIRRATSSLTDAKIDEIGEFGAPQGMFHEWMRSMLRWSNNAAASKCILALGYFYLNGALARAGLFDVATSKGLWLSADYKSHDWVKTDAQQKANAAGPLLTPGWATAQRRRRSNITATAAQVARFMTLLSLNKLVDPRASDEMRALMKADAGGLGSDANDALHKVGRDPSLVIAKFGLGDDGFRHECAIIERTVSGEHLRYVAVGLGYSPKRKLQNWFDLFVLLDEAIVARNK
jgi:LAS superfamily LD-carboxypeptidase LdcB